MAPGALDPLTKELIYVAVSVTNQCEYCIASHTASARKKGMTDEQFKELMAVVGMANEAFKVSAVSLISGETRIVASAVGTREDLKELFELVTKFPIRCKIETRPLDTIGHAFEDLKKGAVTGRIVLTV